MEITEGKEAFLRQYRVLSTEKDTTWEKWNTGPSWSEEVEHEIKCLLQTL
jgi:hypothetical protein